MARYSEIPINKTLNNNIRNEGMNYYTQNKYPIIPFQSSDIYIATEFGDRLDNLANQFYGDITKYWIIAIANPNQISLGSLIPPVGAQLRIPININSIMAAYDALNSETGATLIDPSINDNY